MNAQQTKLAVAGVVIVAIIGGMYGLNRSTPEEKRSRSGELAGADGVDVRQSRLSLGSRSGGPGGTDSSAADVQTARNSGGNRVVDPDVASILDVATTQVLPIETEAETRERERYEEAMANQFQYRKLDPEKIKPVELTPALQQVTTDYEIPDNLLAALMYVESGGSHRYGEHSIEAGYGVMNLRENNLVDTLAEGASLIGKSKDEVLYDQGANIEAAGALLRSYYDDAVASGLSESEAWYAAVSQYSGRQNPELAAHLADETAGWMMRGFELHLSDGGGDVVVPGTPNPPFLPKNWEVVGMTPPSETAGAQILPGTTPPNAQSFSGSPGSALGDAQVMP